MSKGLRMPAQALILLCLACAQAAEGGGETVAGRAERNTLYDLYFDLRALVKGGAVQAHWMADGATFWYAEGMPEATVVYKVSPRTNQKKAMFDTTLLRRRLGELLGHEPAFSGLPFDDFELVDGERAARFTVESRDFVLRLDTHAIAEVKPPTEEEQERTTARVVPRAHRSDGDSLVLEVGSPDARWFATEKDDNLWLRSREDGRRERLTTDGVPGHVWDVEEGSWSPDSSRLAAKKVDSRAVPRLPIVDWLSPDAKVEWVRYPHAGGPIARTEIHVVDVPSGRDVRLDLGGEADHYFFILGWRAGGSELLVLKVGRTMQRLELRAANPSTGTSRLVLAEESPTFLAGGMNLFDGGWQTLVTPLADGKRFILMSERDGFNHLYLYDAQGTLIRRLTEGHFPVVQVVAVDERKGYLYFAAHAETRLYDTHLYRIGLDGRGLTRLTEGDGQHAPEMAPARGYFLDTHSSTDRAPVVELRRADGKLLQVLSKANVDALLAAHWQPPEEFVVKAADGITDLYGALFKPYDLDSGRKYPVIDDIYAGPQWAAVPRAYLEGAPRRGLAHLGFIVLRLDGRGTPERGKSFQDAVYQNLGRNEIPDHVAALRQLAATRPYMDLARVGIVGHSYGGYFAIRALLTAPEVYKVGIASAPPTELLLDPVGIEPYLGLPQEHKDAYDFASNLPLARNLRGRLLLIAGTSDVNVPFSETLRLVDALTKAGKPYDLVVLPDRDHSIPGDAYWRTTVRRYLQEHLQP